AVDEVLRKHSRDDGLSDSALLASDEMDACHVLAILSCGHDEPEGPLSLRSMSSLNDDEVISASDDFVRSCFACRNTAIIRAPGSATDTCVCATIARTSFQLQVRS